MSNLEKSTASSNKSVSQTPSHVALSSEVFLQHYDQFLQEQKPDPLLLKQLQSLQIEWNDGLPFHATDPIEHGATTNTTTNASTNGILTIVGEYTAVALQASCQWTVDVTSGMCKMHFQLHIQASASATTKEDGLALALKQNINATMTKKEERLQDEVRRRIMARLQSDPYIRRINNVKEKVLLCDALIQFKLKLKHPIDVSIVDEQGDITNSATMIPSFSTACTAMDELEERVYVSEDSLEGLRRCMFSHMESPIFAMELLLAMPYLPQRHGSKSMVMDEERMDEKFRGMLSERVILRVLEDVMVDECEREGEDDLLSDLNIEAEQEEELLLVVDTSTTSSGACSIGKRRRKGTHRQLR
eukprot:scaffold10218_cov240-Chaetoceros_neogracile.AAC.6